MSLFLIFLALALFGTGLAFRIRKRGADNSAHVLRITSVLLLTLAPITAIYTIPWVNSHFDWYYVATLALCIVASFVVSFLARNPVRLETDNSFDKKSKEELAKMDDTERKAYKASLKDYKKAHRHLRWSKAPSLVALSAAIAAGIIWLVRLWFHANLEETFDPAYRPTHWWALVVLVVLVAAAIVMRFPLRFKRWWNTLPVVAVAAIVAYFAAIAPAYGNFYEAANKAQETTSEKAADDPPPVELVTEIDKTCPPEYTIPSEKGENGDLTPNQTAIDEIAGPDEVVAGANPDLMLTKIHEAIDDPAFLQSLEEDLREELDARGEEVTEKTFQEAFDTFIAELEAATADDLIVQYGNVLCMTPEAQAVHVALYGW